jgi:hypothetical protein
MNAPHVVSFANARYYTWFWPLACVFALNISVAHGDGIQFVLPINCELGRTCVVQNYVDHDPAHSARDYKCGTLTYHQHDGTDFRLLDLAALKAGVEVLAAADGHVERVRDEMADRMIPTAGAFTDKARACGNGVIIAHSGGWQTQYCHMAKGSVTVVPGQRVAAGQPIGRVGLSGQTQFPHLHFTVRHDGQVVDPFAYGAVAGSCGGGTSLWRAAGPGYAYQVRAVLNAGFASAPVTMEEIEHGKLDRRLGPDTPALVAFVRAIGLQKDDVQHLTVIAPDKRTFADYTAAPLDSAKAQTLLLTGNARPPSGWVPGTYEAHYIVSRNGVVVFDRSFALLF